LKRILLGSVIGLLCVAPSSWGEGDHKIDWCHFPPGQWTGDRATSKFIILSIDEHGIDGHANHDGDGPVSESVPGFSTLGPSCSLSSE
jgi:hypothetical protein